ncbi:MAG: hypothetical protein C0415_00160 [Thermodesulfovibrio sp.]|nr:hypothetical protein [Thermodesulfovibrio sp.]
MVYRFLTISEREMKFFLVLEILILQNLYFLRSQDPIQCLVNLLELAGANLVFLNFCRETYSQQDSNIFETRSAGG